MTEAEESEYFINLLLAPLYKRLPLNHIMIEI